MFMPDTLLARTGQPVHFRSSEDVLHNVRVIRDDHGRCTSALPGRYKVSGFADGTPSEKVVDVSLR